MSSVFGLSSKEVLQNYDEDDDPIMKELHILNYRYMRFIFHPLKDRFFFGSSWKDQEWTDVQSMRTGLDVEERSRRQQVFGVNQIDIEQKPILQLLVDEVCRKRPNLCHVSHTL